jgi:hypothetical protein
MESLYLKAMLVIENLIMSVIVIILSAALKLDIKPLFWTVQLSNWAFENSIQFIIDIPFNVMYVTHSVFGTTRLLEKLQPLSLSHIHSRF